MMSSLRTKLNMLSDNDGHSVGHLVHRDGGSCVISETSEACDENEFCFKLHKWIKGAYKWVK